MVNEHRWLVIIFALYFLMAIGYSLLMPIWEGPDEPAHYLVALTLSRLDRYATTDKNYEAHQPQGFYRLAALVIDGLDKIDKRYSDYFLPYPYYRHIRQPVRIFAWTDANYRFLVGPHILRWLNILIGGGALWLNWRSFRLIVPDEPVKRVAALALGALTPQYLHIMAAISNDALGALAGALLFYLAIRVSLGTPPLHIYLSIIFAIIVPLLTKLTVLPVGIALFITSIWKQASRAQKAGRWVVAGFSLLFLSILILNLLSATTVSSALNQLHWRTLSFREDVFSVGYLGSMLGQVIWSYWGKVGWLAVGLPAWMVILLSTCAILGGIFNVQKLMKLKSQGPRFTTWIVVWIVALLSVMAVLRNGLTTPHSQGRFLFPALGALTLIVVSGWYDRLLERFRPSLPWVVILIMLAANFILWRTGILPVYYQPLID